MMTVLILHSVVVSDCVMGDVTVRYNPAVDDFGNFHMATLPQTLSEVELVVKNTIPQPVYDVVAVAGNLESLANEEEHSHLCSVLRQKIYN